ncbi:MAG: hypothetical protein A2X94_11350 [Bdellovibrionales bacterium GWB1_55_8]|nr:MAG: hypothetical protein A2X94_11350 [Bdellovibrionales bacterium GWB1_55_8]
MKRSNPKWFFLAGLLTWLASFALSLRFGAVVDADWKLIAQLRIPRALLASAVGMGLSTAGATLQALFSNPLCEPYTLGISSGAALGAVIGSALGLQWLLAGLTGSAFIGALAFMGVLFVIAHRPNVSNLSLLLAGVMLGFLGSSLLALWMALSDPEGIQGALVWLLGDLSRARLSGSVASIASMLGLLALIWSRSRELDALLMGEEDALGLGVAVQTVRKRLIILSSLIIAICVSAAGMIGFIGLVVPHFARRFVGSLHRSLLPAVAIWGAAALTLADLVARVATRPYELPVGVVTALIGAPVFLWVMLRKRATP